MPSPSLTLLPNARVQFLDPDGEPYVGGTVGYYVPGTLTAKDTWQDAFQTTANANPLTLDDLGSAAVWGTGFYRQIVKDSSGNTVWDGNTVAPQLGAGSGELFLDSIVVAEAAQIAAGTPTLTLLGYYKPGDGGGGTYLASTAGAGIGKFQSFDGQWWILGEVFYEIPVSPEQLGAVGDGVSANDSVFNNLITLGLPIEGRSGAIYALSTPFVFSSVADFSIENVILKDLTPSGSTRKFVFGSGNASVRMHNVKVLRNGDGSGGSFNSAAAVWIQNCTFVDIVDLEVTGNNAGAGLHLVNCLGGTVDRPYMHDMTAGTPTTPNPGDGTDQIAGVWADNCTNVTISNGTVANLLSQSTAYGPENINTRGYTGGGPGFGVAFTNCTVTNVDEGFDMSGDQNMVGWQITACRASFCRKFGFKAAVSARFGNIVNCYAYRCTLDGFYIQGSNQTLTSEALNTQGIRVVDCTAQGTGFNVGTYYPGFDTAGFRVDLGSDYPTWPRNVYFVNCFAFGEGNMKFGFTNSIGPTYLDASRCKLINCVASNFTQLANNGFVDAYSVLSLSADQAVSSNVDTPIVFDHVINGLDGFLFLSGGGTSNLEFPYAVRAEIQVSVAWEVAAGNDRTAAAFINGTRIPGQRDVRQGDATGEVTNIFTFIWDFVQGDILSVNVQQTTGSPLNINGGDTNIIITDTNGAQQLVTVI